MATCNVDTLMQDAATSGFSKLAERNKLDVLLQLLCNVSGNGKVLSGTGAPDNADGDNGDLYVDLSSGDLYVKTGDAWATVGGGSDILSNYTATSAPDANDDSGDGYSVGSLWVYTTATPKPEVFFCVDATAASAVWLAIDSRPNRVSGFDSGITITSSSTPVHSGTGVVLTPRRTGTVKVAFSGSFRNNNSAARCVCYLAYGTGSLPTLGAAGSGTVISATVYSSNINFGFLQPVSFVADIAGLTLGQSYWFDVVFYRFASFGTCYLGGPSYVAEEVIQT